MLWKTRGHEQKWVTFYSWFLDLLIRVPQGSPVGHLLFNIHLCDLFFFIEEQTLISYADETSPFLNGTY